MNATCALSWSTELDKRWDRNQLVFVFLLLQLHAVLSFCIFFFNATNYSVQIVYLFLKSGDEMYFSIVQNYFSS